MSETGFQPLPGYVYAGSNAVNHDPNTPGGSVDEITDDRIAGWCANPRAAGDPVALELRVKHHLLAEFAADVTRRDIAKYYGAASGCGFSFNFTDIPADRASEVLAELKERLLKLPNEAADLHVTVRRSTLEIPRWGGLVPRLDNKRLLAFLQARLAPETIGWFDADWYRDQTPEVRTFGLDPFQHYSERGFREGRPPNEIIKRELGEVGIWPLNPLAGPQAHIVALIAQSGLFEAAWYSERYGIAEDEAIAHYVSTGAFLGYDPSPFFDSFAYLKENTEAAEGGFNPLGHMIQGFAKGEDGATPLAGLRLRARDWLEGL